MNTSFQKVIRFIERHSMLYGARGVLVAVSGGPDSVTLLDMLMAGVGGWGLGVGGNRQGVSKEAPGNSKPQPQTPNPHLHVAHLDHMLRDRESSEDAEFVRALAERLGLQITIRSVDVRAAASSSGRGIEEIAREIRYDFLLAAALEAGCDRIAVGHTMTDQAETFLMRLVRGAGLRGLAAMRPVSAVPTGRGGDGERRRGGDGAPGRERDGANRDQEITGQSAVHIAPSPPLPVSPSPLLIRPLLCITREEVESYCRERGLEFRSDETNLSLHYTRNRLRSEVMPALRSINPRIVESISRAAGNIAGDQDVLDGLALSLLRKARLVSDNRRDADDGGAAAYSVAALMEQPAGMRRRMIIEAIRLARADVTGKNHNTGGEAGSAHVAAVETLLAANSSGKHIELPRSLEVWREFDALVLKPRKRAPKDPSYFLSISSTRPDFEAGGFAFTLEREMSIELRTPVIEETFHESNRTGRNWMAVALDDQSLPERLVLRPRLPGERAHVIGRRRTIKLKNLMIDHRIPSSRRASWPLVTTSDGAYIWSPGLPPALEFAARDETPRLAIMRASPL